MVAPRAACAKADPPTAWNPLPLLASAGRFQASSGPSSRNMEDRGVDEAEGLPLGGVGSVSVDADHGGRLADLHADLAAPASRSALVSEAR